MGKECLHTVLGFALFAVVCIGAEPATFNDCQRIALTLVDSRNQEFRPSQRARIEASRNALEHEYSQTIGSAVTSRLKNWGSESNIFRLEVPNRLPFIGRIPNGKNLRTNRSFVREFDQVQRLRRESQYGAQLFPIDALIYLSIEGMNTPVQLMPEAFGNLDDYMRAYPEQFGLIAARNQPLAFLRMFEQMTMPVLALHLDGKVHWDIKLENYLALGSKGEFGLYLTDLGLLTERDKRPEEIEEDKLIGTLFYMSPDRRRGTPERTMVVAKPHQDVFSLLATFYGMILRQNLARKTNRSNIPAGVIYFGPFAILDKLDSQIIESLPFELQNVFDLYELSCDPNSEITAQDLYNRIREGISSLRRRRIGA